MGVEKKEKAKEMAQWLNMLATKPDNLNSILRTHMLEKENPLNMVVHAFNPSTGEARSGGLCELKASLVYITSSRLARAT